MKDYYGAASYRWIDDYSLRSVKARIIELLGEKELKTIITNKEEFGEGTRKIAKERLEEMNKS